MLWPDAHCCAGGERQQQDRGGDEGDHAPTALGTQGVAECRRLAMVVQPGVRASIVNMGVLRGAKLVIDDPIAGVQEERKQGVLMRQFCARVHRNWQQQQREQGSQVSCRKEPGAHA